MRVYKLTDQNNRTFGSCLWGENVTHEAPGIPQKLCSQGFLHYYHTATMAMVMNSVHGDYCPARMKLWEAEADGLCLNDNYLKGGCTRLTTLREIEKPLVTMDQRIVFAILCSLVQTREPGYVEWARKWLSGEDRSKESANDASSMTCCDTAYDACRAAFYKDSTPPGVAENFVAHAAINLNPLFRINFQMILNDAIAGNYPPIQEMRDKYRVDVI